jgi:hypothetical protein
MSILHEVKQKFRTAVCSRGLKSYIQWIGVWIQPLQCIYKDNREGPRLWLIISSNLFDNIMSQLSFSSFDKLALFR